MTVGRVSQISVEVLLQAAPAARLTRQAVELLLHPATEGRLGQQSFEVLQSEPKAGSTQSRARSMLILCWCC